MKSYLNLKKNTKRSTNLGTNQKSHSVYTMRNGFLINGNISHFFHNPT